MAEAIVLSLRSIQDADKSGLCATIMGIISVLAEAGTSRHLLYVAAASWHVDAAGIDAAVGRLADASLVGFAFDRSAVVAHRLVMRIVRETLIADGVLPATVEAAVQALGELADSIVEAWHDPAKVRIPAYHPETPEVRKDWAQYYDIITEADADAGARLKELADLATEDAHAQLKLDV